MRSVNWGSKVILTAGVCGLALSLAACNSGGTGGGENANDDGGIYVAGSGGGSGAGRIEIDLNEDHVSVAHTTGFHARVFDADGAAVENIKVSCDSERGVAIIEPNTGSETTDSGGQISGRLGCEAPGSFLFGCRTPVGGAKRKFVTLICQGSIPAGFAGFPSAAGGGLGGGVSTGEDGDSGSAEITAVSIYDGSENSSTGIDVQQGLCGDAPNQTAEPFGDTIVKIKVVNNYNADVRFTKMNYTVLDYDGSGHNFNSDDINLIGGSAALDANGGEDEVAALFADAFGSGQKRFHGSATEIGEIGFKNVTIRLFGTTTAGDEVRISGRIAISFDNFDRCTS